jgi:hypothetical protein
MIDANTAAADLLQGAETIAVFCRQCGLITMNAKKVCQWREAGKLPVGKVGGHLIASKAAITAALLSAATATIPPVTHVPVRPLVHRRHRRSA